MTKLKNNISELGCTIDGLYNEDYQINIHLSNKPYTYHVVLKDRKGFDCKISSFAANLYTRTKKGLEYKKYNSIGTLQTELKKLIGRKIETDNSIISFSLSKDICIF